MPEPMPLADALRAVQAVAAQYRDPTPDDAAILVAYLEAHAWHYPPIPCGTGWTSFAEWIQAYQFVYGVPLIRDPRYPALLATARDWYGANG